MSFSDFLRKLNNHIGTHKVHLCPAVKGRLVNNGIPLENVRISRTLSYSDGKYTEDHCYTCRNGEFEMPEMSLRSSQPALLIAEKIVYQLITVVFADVEYKLWSSTPSGIRDKKEYSLKLGSLNCDIQNEEVSFYFKGNQESHKYRASGICRWGEDFLLIDHESEFAKMIEGAL
ncbi:hypothetical protein Q4591_08440 [Shewanella sp. 3_MG-2023]|uniref:DUF6795 domain-containing protein n=1 Tax=Shewanella sp. 3_MG-2023 TaxID=3062635 RepID=UPI0026E3C108|nr:DUF6795 domain-containing protein [Shewanella sp. 3_MG-2023]MDO6775381.1 hypothetical protein [Shewanella sp. 3_MG-2023]